MSQILLHSLPGTQNLREELVNSGPGDQAGVLFLSFFLSAFCKSQRKSKQATGYLRDFLENLEQFGDLADFAEAMGLDF